MSSEIDPGFETVACDEYCLRVADGTHDSPKQTTNGKLLVTSKNVKDGRLLLDSAYLISDEDFAEINRRSKVDQWDLLLTMIGTVGEVCIVSQPNPMFAIKNVGLLKCGSELRAKWLYYFLRSSQGQQLIEQRKKGSTQQYISLAEIRNFPVSYPANQRDMRDAVSVLSLLDDRITLLRETNATLEAIAQALFKSWFVDFDPVRAKAEGRQPEGMDAHTAALFPDSFEESELGLVPKGWTVVRLGDVTERITKGTTPTTLKRPFVESGINFVKVESITDDGQLLPGKFAYIDDETHCLLGRSQLKADDVLITIAGTIGRVAVITEDFIPANTNQAVAIVRPDASKLPSAFVNQFLRLADSKSRMGERVVQAVQANLSLGSLSDMKLVMPPSELVTKLHDLVFDSVESKRNSNQQCIRTLTQLRETLLPRLISGQLRLPDAEQAVEEALA